MDDVDVSVIIPCRNAACFLRGLLDSVLAAADRFDGKTEVLLADDASSDSTPQLIAAALADPRVRSVQIKGYGVSAARNYCLDAASGRFIMFADADDSVSPQWISAPVKAMLSSNADYCKMGFNMRIGDDASFAPWPVKGNYNYSSSSEIIRDYIPRMIGFSFADLRHWASGGELFDSHELGGVWCCVYRRELIEKFHVRFDESIRLGEDAFFNCRYLIHASSMVQVNDALYNYTMRKTGSSLRLMREGEVADAKLRQLMVRKAIDAESGGALREYYAASCVLGACELLRSSFAMSPRSVAVGFSRLREFLRDDAVRSALSSCPLFWSKPLFSAAVLILKAMKG